MTITAFLAPLSLTRPQTMFAAQTHARPELFRTRRSDTAKIVMCAPQQGGDDDDDDDTSFGKMEAPDVYGMQMPPNLSEADKDYLDGAKNGDEFLARVAQIARRVNLEERKASGRKLYSQTSDYFAQLSKKE